jgi:prophage maintenance system killer protein
MSSLVIFLDLNGVHWDPDLPAVDESERAILAVASNEWNETEFARWLRQRVEFV